MAGGHGMNFRQITPHFAASIPFIRPINPNTGGGWETSGVKPDVSCAAEEALKTAHVAALRAVLRDKPAGEERTKLARTLDDLEHGRDPDAASERGGPRFVR